MIAAINTAAPDVLWVGMTAPKQEKWLHQHQSQLNAKFAAAVGAGVRLLQWPGQAFTSALSAAGISLVTAPAAATASPLVATDGRFRADFSFGMCCGIEERRKVKAISEMKFAL